MISEFCSNKIPNSGMTYLVSEFDEKLQFTVGRLNGMKIEYFYTKRKTF